MVRYFSGEQLSWGDYRNGKTRTICSCGFSGADSAEIARSLRSHDFNFLLINIPKGIQHITVEGSVEAGPTAGPAFGVIGKGSLEATVVNLKDDE
jgi:hypothetical protein